jgi:hypothetical protein
VAWGERRRRSFEVDTLHGLPEVVALANEVAEVLIGNFGLDSGFGCLFLLLLQPLDVALEADANVVCGALQCAANLGADAESVLVGVVDGRELL